MAILDDWVVKLRYDDSEVTAGLRRLDSQIKRLSAPNLNPIVGRVPNNPVANAERRFPSNQVRDEVRAYDERERREAALERQRLSAERRVRAEAERTAREDQRRRRQILKERQVERQREMARENITPTAAAQRSSRGRISTGVNQATIAINALGNRTDEESIALKRQLQQKIKTLTEVQKRLGSSTTFNRKQYDKLQDAIADTRRQTSSLVSNVRAQTKAFDAQRFAANGLRNSLRNLANSYISVFAAFEGIKKVGSIVVGLESVKASLQAASGSADKAAEDFKFIQDVSFALGRDLLTSAKGYQQVGTAAAAAGLTSDETKEIFLAGSEAAVAFGLSVDDTSGVFRAFSQILSKGTVSAEELRQQLGDRLFGAFELYAESLDISTEKLDELLQAGEVGSETIIGFAKTLRGTVRETGAFQAGLSTIRTGIGKVTNALVFLIDEVFGDLGGLGSALEEIAISIGAMIPFIKGLVGAFGLLFNVIFGVVGIIDQLLKSIGFDSGALGITLFLLTGLLLRKLVPAMIKMGSTATAQFLGMAAAANGSAAAVSNLARAFTAAKIALKSLLVSTGIGFLFVAGGMGLEKLLESFEGEDKGKVELDTLDDRIARFKRSIRDPSSVTAIGSQSDNSKTVNNVFHNTFNTNSDVQDINRTLENQSFGL